MEEHQIQSLARRRAIVLYAETTEGSKFCVRLKQQVSTPNESFHNGRSYLGGMLSILGRWLGLFANGLFGHRGHIHSVHSTSDASEIPLKSQSQKVMWQQRHMTFWDWDLRGISE